MEFPVQEVHRPAIRIEPIEMMRERGDYLKRGRFSWIFPWREKNFIDEKGQAFFLNFREIILGISREPLSPPFSGGVDRCTIHPKPRNGTQAFLPVRVAELHSAVSKEQLRF